jgi:hypothetical protein
MIQVFAIMIILFVVLSVVFLIKIKNVATRLMKTKEINNQENPLEEKYQFIKGLF